MKDNHEDKVLSEGDTHDLTDRGTFRHWHRITIRSTDEDPLGHVNNCVYAEWIEVARVLLIRQYLAEAPDGVDTVLASMTIDFLNETGFPGEVEVGARLIAVGNRSLRSAYGVFQGAQCLATSRCVNVFFDMQTRRSTAPTDAMRVIMKRDLV
ncbi:MAG: acyl-CoA thioesterase [Geminicoccaceae bacterium]